MRMRSLTLGEVAEVGGSGAAHADAPRLAGELGVQVHQVGPHVGVPDKLRGLHHGHKHVCSHMSGYQTSSVACMHTTCVKGMDGLRIGWR